MYCLDITRYNARKRRVEDAVRWFIQKYLPRHHIYIKINHRGLRREGSYGYCSVSGAICKPREFLIEIDPKLDLELYTKTILYELYLFVAFMCGLLLGYIVAKREDN